MGPFQRAANFYHSKGFNVIPIAKGTKKPLIAWKEYATRRMRKDELDELVNIYGDQNIAVITGKVSGLAVVDIDGQAGEVILDKLPQTLKVKTNRGWHLYFKSTEEHSTCISLYPKVDLKMEHSYVVAPPSMHEMGTEYKIEGKYVDPVPIPDWLIESSVSRNGFKSREGLAEAILKGVNEGERNDMAARYSGFLIDKGYGEAECIRMLRAWNSKNRPPLPENELLRCYYSIVQKHGSNYFQVVTSKALEKAKETVSKWIYLEDDSIVEVVLAVAATTRIAADPLWIMLIAPPGSGKTELLRSLKGVPDFYYLDRITEATFITGHKDMTGVLEKSNRKNIMFIVKDFGDVLSIERGSVMQQFRSIYDGEYSARYGNQKGTVEWKGKANMLCAVTQEIESLKSQSIIGPLGERFLYYKMVPKGRETHEKMAMKSIEASGKEHTMRMEISEAMQGAFKETLEQDLSKLEIPPHILSWISDLCQLMVKMRMVVKRTGPNAEGIDYKPSPESPTRMLKCFKQLLLGLCLVNKRKEAVLNDYKIVAKIAMDGMNSMRRDCLRSMLKEDPPRWMGVTDVCEKTLIPYKTVNECLGNLALSELVDKAPFEMVAHQYMRFGFRPREQGGWVYRLKEDTINMIRNCGLEDVL